MSAPIPADKPRSPDPHGEADNPGVEDHARHEELVGRGHGGFFSAWSVPSVRSPL